MNRQIDSDLPPKVQEILGEFARRLGPSGDLLAQQATVATVVQASATWIDCHVSEDVARGQWSNGVLPVSPTVMTPNGNLGGSVHVWVTAGALTAIEQGWFTDDRPGDWPTLDQLVWS